MVIGAIVALGGARLTGSSGRVGIVGRWTVGLGNTTVLVLKVVGNTGSAVIYRVETSIAGTGARHASHCGVVFNQRRGTAGDAEAARVEVVR